MSATSRWRSADTLAVDHVSFSDQARRMRGAGRRVRLRKIRQRVVDPEAAAVSQRLASLRPIRFRGRELLTAAESEMREIRGNDISIIFQEPMTSLNPLHTIEAQIGEILLLHSGISGADGAGAHAGTVDAGRHSRSRNPAEELSASIVRRPAPARHDRDGARQRAGPPDRGRADHRARCHRAGPDPGAARPRSASRLGMSMLFITHDLGIVRRIADVVCVMNSRQDRRAGAGRAGLHRAEACLYPRAAGGRAEARSGAAAARTSRW